MNSLERTLTADRGRYIGLAYRMLGSRTDAEDILQDAYLKAGQLGESNVQNEEAFLVTMVTRLCLDLLKSARVRREVYVGPWLPEPILDAEQLTPEDANELADDLSFALMMTLEKLSASERASFLLHDVFDTPFARIAQVLGKNEATCRQLAARARKSIQSARTGTRASQEVHQTLLLQFAEAARTGDTIALEKMLAEDAIAYTDGGGQINAALRPIFGADKVTRLFVGLARKHLPRLEAIEMSIHSINGQPGLILKIDGVVDQTITLDVVDEKIRAIYVVRNPRKLEAIDRSDIAN